MTDEERKIIRTMRLEGVGYKAIATALQMSRDTIRAYCKRSGLGGQSTFLELTVQEQIEEGNACKHCLKSIKQKPKGRERKFCSDACRRKWWLEHQEARNKNDNAIYHYTCEYCEKEFTAYGNKNRKYCSHGCYIKHRFEEGNDGV